MEPGWRPLLPCCLPQLAVALQPWVTLGVRKPRPGPLSWNLGPCPPWAAPCWGAFEQSPDCLQAGTRDTGPSMRPSELGPWASSPGQTCGGRQARSCLCLSPSLSLSASRFLSVFPCCLFCTAVCSYHPSIHPSVYQYLLSSCPILRSPPGPWATQDGAEWGPAYMASLVAQMVKNLPAMQETQT